MSQDLASLAIKVDSSGVVTASKDLDTLAGRAKATETATASMNSGFDKLKQNWMAVSIAVVAFAAAMQKAIQYMELGAKALQVESSFKIMTDAAGVSGQAMINSMKAATRETIDDSALMAKAVKMMVMGYDSTQIEEFTKNIVAASQVAGVSVNEAYDQIADAIANKMPKALIRYGAITKDQMAIVTQAMAAGVDGAELLALVNANLAVQAAKLKGTVDGATIALQQYHAEIDATKEAIGKGLIVGMQKLYAVFQDLAAVALLSDAALYKLLQGMAALEAKTTFGQHSKNMQALADSFKIDADAALAASADLFDKAGKNLSGTADVSEKASAQEIKTLETFAATIKKRIALLAGEPAAMTTAFEAMKEMDKLATDEAVKNMQHRADMATILGQNEFDARQKSLNDQVAIDKLAHDNFINEMNMEATAKLATEREKFDSVSFYAQKEALLLADDTAKANERARQLEKYNAEKNEAVRASTGEMYMAINQYSQESTDFQIAEIKRLAAQKTITTSGGVSGNEVAVAQWTADQIEKIYAARDNAMVTADLAMWNEINSHSREAMKLQVTLWEAQAAEYIRLGHEKGLVEDWLQAKKIQYDQDWLRTEIDFYSQLKGYEDTYRILKFQWIDNEEKRLADLYKDDLAAFKWAQQEKLKLNTELSKSNTAAAVTKNATPTGAPAANGQQFSMTWANYTGFLTKEVVAYLNEQQRKIEYHKADPQREEIAKNLAQIALDDALKALEDIATASEAAAKTAQDIADKAAADVITLAEETAKKATDIAKQKRDLEIQLMDVLGQTSEALAARRADELAAMDATLRPLQELIWLTEDWAGKLKEATVAAVSAVNAQIEMSKAASQNARQAADEYRNIIDSLTTEQTKINGGGTVGAQGRLDTVFASAMTGDQTALKGLPGAIDDMLANSLKSSKTAEDYARAQGQALIQLGQAKIASTAMVNWEEYQATLLETQTGILEQIRDNLGQTNPNMELLTKQVGLLTTIGTLLQEQTVQIVSGDGMQALIMQDQTGKIIQTNEINTNQTGQIVMGNSWLATQVAATVGVNSAIGSQTAEIINGDSTLATNLGRQTAEIINGDSTLATNLGRQTAEIINGNLIIKDQNGLILSSNTLLTDQTGKIIIGNTLTGTQTDQVITGNATQDVIKNISNLNTSYSEEMLAALIAAGSTQTGSLQSIATQTSLTVSAIQQLIALTATTQAAQAEAARLAEIARLAAEAKAEADRLAAAKAAADAAAAAKKAADDAAAAAKAAADAAAAKKVMSTVETAPTYWIPEKDTRSYDYNGHLWGGSLTPGHQEPAHGYTLYADGHKDYYAEGGIFTNGIVSQPTMFNQSQMGENGPEAIMPLVRGPQGLGVRGGGDNVITIEELRLIRKELQDLKAGNLAEVKNTSKMAKIFQRFDDDGMPAVRTV